MTAYKGRFAPSPSGPAHLGTLLAALGSYLQARSQNGIWHVRIDDIDPPREVPGAADSILRTLDDYDLHWDGSVIYQSQRQDAYQNALNELKTNNRLFNCACSRKTVEKIARIGANGAIYPGTCRDKNLNDDEGKSIRLYASDIMITVSDQIQGEYSLNIQEDVGDFIVKRSDGLFAYHLATVVDDALDGYTEIVRGQDLLSITPQQVFLQQQLGLPTPGYAHLPLLTDNAHVKLSKRSGARPIHKIPQTKVFQTLLEALGIEPPKNLDLNNARETLDWALEHWTLQNVPANSKIFGNAN